MVFMGYETPVQMPSMGVYDTDLMKMYIAGVKDQYEKGQEEYKDFLKSYSDFYSPIEGDTENYYNMTVGGAKKLIDQIYAMGGDPFKNPEARAAISRYIAGVPTAELNAIRQNAENRRIYDRAVAEAIANGTYNKEYEDWLLKNANLNDFQTIDPNTGDVRMWNRLAPGMYQDLHTFSDDWFKHLKPKYNDALTKSKKDGYNYSTITEDDLRNVIRQNVPDIINDGGQGQFFYEQALKVADGDEDAAKTIFEDMVVNRNSDRLMIDREVNPYYKSAYDTQQARNQYWSTTGYPKDNTGDNTNVKHTGKSQGGARKDDPDGYSRFASMTASSLERIRDLSRNAVAYYKTTKTEGGNVHKEPVYAKTMTLKDKNGRQVTSVFIPTQRGGDYVDDDGKRYEMLTLEKAQKMALKGVAGKKGAKAYDVWSNIRTSYNQNAKQVTVDKKMLDNMYSPNYVMSNAYGMSNTSSKVDDGDRQKILSYLRNAQNDSVNYPLSVYEIGYSADISMKGENGTPETIDKYKEYVFDLGGNKIPMLVKVGEYDGNINSPYYYTPTPRWNTYMSELDRVESTDIVGTSDAKDINF